MNHQADKRYPPFFLSTGLYIRKCLILIFSLQFACIFLSVGVTKTYAISQPKVFIAEESLSFLFASAIADSLKVSNSEQSLKILSSKYCGSDDKGMGRFLVLGVNSTTGVQLRGAFIKEDCEKSISDVTKRIEDSFLPKREFKVVEITASWHPSEIQFYLSQVASYSYDGSISIKRYINTKIKSLSTSGFKVKVDDETSIYTLAFTFAKGGILISAPQSWPPINTPADEDGTSSLLLFDVGRMKSFGALFWIPLDWLNNELTQHTIDFDYENERLIVKNPRVLSNTDKIIMTGAVQSQNISSPLNVTLTLRKSDLRVDDIKIETTPEDCSKLFSSDQIACNLRNAALKGGAAMFSNYATTRLNGRSYNFDNFGHPYLIDFNGKRYELRFASQEVSGTQEGIMALTSWIVRVRQ